MNFIKSKVNFLILSVVIFVALFISNYLFAYDEVIIHPNLTEEMAKFYNKNFQDNELTRHEIELMRKGSTDEDIYIGLATRSANHFYNPLGTKKWVDATSKGEIVPEPKLTSKEWARDSAAQATSPGGDYTWETAIKDYASGNKDRAYEGLGHILHLIEDAAVPAHVRSDLHISPKEFEAQKDTYAGKVFFDYEPYESWTGNQAKSRTLKFNFAESLFNENKKPIILNTLDEYFDEMAAYTNTRFFSKDTIYTYLEPNNNAVEGSEKLSNGDIVNYIYRIDENGKKFKLAEISDKNSKHQKILILDDSTPEIHSDYWSRLAPKAVLVGAGVIKLFKEEAEKAAKNYNPTTLSELSKYSYDFAAWTAENGGTVARNGMMISLLAGNSVIYGARQVVSAAQSAIYTAASQLQSGAENIFAFSKAVIIGSVASPSFSPVPFQTPANLAFSHPSPASLPAITPAPTVKPALKTAPAVSTPQPAQIPALTIDPVPAPIPSPDPAFTPMPTFTPTPTPAPTEDLSPILQQANYGTSEARDNARFGTADHGLPAATPTPTATPTPEPSPSPTPEATPTPTPIPEPIPAPIPPVYNATQDIYYSAIQPAIDAAAPDDEINVNSGTYFENVEVNKKIVLKGIDTGAGKPIVDAGNSGSAITLNADEITLAGFSAKSAATGVWPNAGILVKSHKNTIKNNAASGNEYGIVLYYSKNNLLSGNEVLENKYGIQLYYSSDNALNGNTANSRALASSLGIILTYSSGNSLDKNTASNNFWGIQLGNESNRNIVTDNVLLSNINGGIEIVYSYGNMISGNVVDGNGYGIFIFSGALNKIYHNNFTNSTQYNVDDKAGASNIWDDGYPSGGNYWSDYRGADSDGDNIGDIPYPIYCDNFVSCGGGTYDNYPLTSPYPPPSE